jgi:hypothetical protein
VTGPWFIGRFPTPIPYRSGRLTRGQVCFLSERFMSEIVELPYRRFHRHVIDRLVRTGYLPTPERHDMAAVPRMGPLLARCRSSNRKPQRSGQRGMKRLRLRPELKESGYRRRTDVPIGKRVRGKRRRIIGNPIAPSTRHEPAAMSRTAVLHRAAENSHFPRLVFPTPAGRDIFD